MTRGKIYFLRMASDVTHLWACDKTILESEFQHKENKQTKPRILSKILQLFLAGTDSENKIILILHKKKDKKVWTKISSLGQEPTFNRPQS